jgi:hypothetical protein
MRAAAPRSIVRGVDPFRTPAHPDHDGVPSRMSGRTRRPRGVTCASLDRIELLHEDVVADARAVAALLDAAQRGWRPHRAAPSVADVFARLDAVSLRAAGALPAPPRWRVASGWWNVVAWARLASALDVLRVHLPWPRHADALAAPERFLSRQDAVRALVGAVRRLLEARRDDAGLTGPAAGRDAARARAALDTLTLLVERQRRLLDLALRIAERGGFLDASVGVDDERAPALVRDLA